MRKALQQKPSVTKDSFNAYGYIFQCLLKVILTGMRTGTSLPSGSLASLKAQRVPLAYERETARKERLGAAELAVTRRRVPYILI
jgi:hypothetical protein